MKLHRRSVLGFGAASAGLLLMGRTAEAAPGLEGPLPDPVEKGLQVWDPRDQGYVAEEYLLSGTAPVYESVSMADAVDTNTRDSVADQARRTFSRKRTGPDQPYVTRLIVYRPRDAARFSGNVILECVHPGGGGHAIVWSAINRFFMDHGDAYVAVQHPSTFEGLKKTEAARYARLAAAHPTQLWGMIADSARRLKDGRGIGGLKARRLYMTGYSFTGVATATFANFHHDETRLAGGKPVFDAYLPMANATYVRPLDVPVMRMNTESDFGHFGGMNNRGEEGPRYRIYELAGCAHVATPHPQAGAAKPPRPVATPEAPGQPHTTPQACYASFPKGSRPNEYPTRLVEAALFRNLYAWVDEGRAPPRSRFIETDADGAPLRDAFGNARGGVRLPTVEAPNATYEASRAEDCFLFGYTLPFTPDRMRELYGDKAGYVAKVAAASDRAIADGFLLPEGAAELKAWAAAAENI